MHRDTVWSILMGIFVIAIVFMLVRPGAPAGQAVKDVTDALSSMMTVATHGLPSLDQTTASKGQLA